MEKHSMLRYVNTKFLRKTANEENFERCQDALNREQVNEAYHIVSRYVVDNNIIGLSGPLMKAADKGLYMLEMPNYEYFKETIKELVKLFLTHELAFEYFRLFFLVKYDLNVQEDWEGTTFVYW